MRYGLLSRKYGRMETKAQNANEKSKAHEKRLKFYTLMVYEDADATLLRLFECFMESAPQLILQIYILIRNPISLNMNPNPDQNPEDLMIKNSIKYLRRDRRQ